MIKLTISPICFAISVTTPTIIATSPITPLAMNSTTVATIATTAMNSPEITRQITSNIGARKLTTGLSAAAIPSATCLKNPTILPTILLTVFMMEPITVAIVCTTGFNASPTFPAKSAIAPATAPTTSDIVLNTGSSFFSTSPINLPTTSAAPLILFHAPMKKLRNPSTLFQRYINAPTSSAIAPTMIVIILTIGLFFMARLNKVVAAAATLATPLHIVVTVVHAFVAADANFTAVSYASTAPVNMPTATAAAVNTSLFCLTNLMKSATLFRTFSICTPNPPAALFMSPEPSASIIFATPRVTAVFAFSMPVAIPPVAFFACWANVGNPPVPSVFSLISASLS